MQTYQVSFTQDVRFADIEAALALVGEFTIIAKRAPKPKAEREYQEPVTVYRMGTDEVVRELNPIEVERGMRKIQAECDARMRADGRKKLAFERATYQSSRADDGETIAAYVREFCSNLSHVKAEYQLGNRTISA